MTAKRPTLVDVARRAGLSATAASMILNGRPNTRLSEEAHHRVHLAASELGYRPNIAARSLRTEKTATIGFISDIVATTRFASGLIRGALEASEEADHVVLVLETRGEPEGEAKAIRAVLDRQVDGIIFATMRAREIAVSELPSGLEVVMLNATNRTHANSVLPDEEAGGRAAVELLVGGGLAGSVVLLGHSDRPEPADFRSTTVSRRVAGIRSAMADRGIGFVEEIAVREWEPWSGYEATKSLLQRRRHVGALLCMNDRLAFGAYQAIAEAGLAVPSDISVASFDNDEIASYLRPGLSTVGIPHEAMGRKAVEVLLGGVHTGEVLVPMPVVRRGSVSPLV